MEVATTLHSPMQLYKKNRTMPCITLLDCTKTTKKQRKMVEFKVAPIKPRMAVEVCFIVPELNTHVSFNLIKDEQNYMIHGSFRCYQNILTLKSKLGGQWQQRVTGSDVCFKRGEDVAIRYEARDEH